MHAYFVRHVFYHLSQRDRTRQETSIFLFASSLVRVVFLFFFWSRKYYLVVGDNSMNNCVLQICS